VSETSIIVADETVATLPFGGYAGIEIGRAHHGADLVAVARQTRAAQAHAAGGVGGSPTQRFCIDGFSHWNPASAFRTQAMEYERKGALYREAADIIEGYLAASGETSA
jgi:hypothetical protein